MSRRKAYRGMGMEEPIASWYSKVTVKDLEEYTVKGLDIRRSFVKIATALARREGVSASFTLGDAAKMPFADASFDFIVCRAAEMEKFAAATPFGTNCEIHQKPIGMEIWLRPSLDADIIQENRRIIDAVPHVARPKDQRDLLSCIL